MATTIVGPTNTATPGIQDSIQTLFDSAYGIAYRKQQVWIQAPWINWFPDLGQGEGRHGSNISFNVFNAHKPVTAPAVEMEDPDPEQMSNANVVIGIAEYNKPIGGTEMLNIESFDDMMEAAAKLTAINQAQSLDFIVRKALLDNVAYVLRPNANALRTGLDATNDKITYSFLTTLKARARTRGVMPVDGSNYASIVSPALAPDVLQTAEWVAVKEYSDPSDLYNAEIGTLAGIRFMDHEYGKLFLGGGTALQTATTTTGAVVAGATSVTVTSATGITAGDYITVGTLEADDCEQVLVTNVAGAVLTIQGVGNEEQNVGFRFAHAGGASVVEAANVALLPLIGSSCFYGVSVAGKYGGRSGAHGIGYKETWVPDRFWRSWWKWAGGFNLRKSQTFVAEVAVSGGVLDTTLHY